MARLRPVVTRCVSPCLLRWGFWGASSRCSVRFTQFHSAPPFSWAALQCLSCCALLLSSQFQCVLVWVYSQQQIEFLLPFYCAAVLSWAQLHRSEKIQQQNGCFCFKIKIKWFTVKNAVNFRPQPWRNLVVGFSQCDFVSWQRYWSCQDLFWWRLHAQISAHVPMMERLSIVQRKV